MKLYTITISLLAASIFFSGCKDALEDMSNPSRSGNKIDLFSTDTFIDFSIWEVDKYPDFQGGLFPIVTEPIYEGQEVLTETPVVVAPMNADGTFRSTEDPIIFHATAAPNYGQKEMKEANFGVEYTAEFRLTDDIKVEMDGTDSLNEPQAFIMAAIFLADGEPNGAIMAMAFRNDAFPSKVTIPLNPDQNTGFDQNVFLALNYDGESSGWLVGTAEVDIGIDRFHEMTLQIKDDAQKNENGITNGPSVSVVIDGEPVISYWNDGNNHGLDNGVWDKKHEVKFWGITAETLYIHQDILGIENGGYFNDGTGVDVWNQSWNAAIFQRPDTDPDFPGLQTSLVTFGAMMNLGTDDSGWHGGAPGCDERSPEVKSVKVSGMAGDQIAQIDFSQGGNSDDYIVSGFSHQEVDWTWTDGESAEMTIPLEETGSYYNLRFSFEPFVPDNHQQNIKLFINGESRDKWEWEYTHSHHHREQTTSVRIPGDLVTGNDLNLTFELPDAISPKEAYGSDDERKLGMALREMDLEMIELSAEH